METEQSKYPSNKINTLVLKFGASSLQTFVSPQARAQKEVMQNKLYSGAL